MRVFRLLGFNLLLTCGLFAQDAAIVNVHYDPSLNAFVGEPGKYPVPPPYLFNVVNYPCIDVVSNQWRFIISQLPPGVQVQLDGTITGAPTVTGLYQFVIQARGDYRLGYNGTSSVPQCFVWVVNLNIPCDVNGDGVVNVIDVQIDINMALGSINCSNAGDPDQDNVCNVIDVQRLVNAAITGFCKIGP